MRFKIPKKDYSINWNEKNKSFKAESGDKKFVIDKKGLYIECNREGMLDRNVEYQGKVLDRDYSNKIPGVYSIVVDVLHTDAKPIMDKAETCGFW